ncbi:MAG: hypothetical protein KIT11_02855 [Fimbriimonadaceae bacterium]|nr:hypothetical protein [Fimbriimonadaceae bacterium]QYK54692.1 MAG: hypothetical protein KF733_06670 [Fimbriimonadaceae bacterium]
MVLAAFLLGATLASAQDWPQSKAERTEFRETSSYEDVLGFLDGLQTQSPDLSVQFIGESARGQKLPLVIASRPLITNPLEAKRLGKPVLYVQATIHGGEVEGKEAVLHLLRRYLQEKTGILDKAVLLVTPVYNIDGNDSFGPQETNRPGQNGPAIVGQRANGDGLDLNRDHIKALSPEMRSLLREVYTKWEPDLMMDLHTTDGTRHGYPITYLTPLNPLTNSEIDRFAREKLMQTVKKGLNDDFNLPIFDYGNLETIEGKKGWYVTGVEGRYSTSYLGLRNRIGVLCESLVYVPFKQRVLDTERFVDATLNTLLAQADVLHAIYARADREAADSVGKEFAVRSEFGSRGQEAVMIEKPGAQPQGVPTDLEPLDLTIYDRYVPTKLAKMPSAYLVPPRETRLLELLHSHGVRLEVALESWEGRGETFSIDEVKVARQAFQGVRMTTLEGRFQPDRTTVQAGDVLVRTNQPLALLAFHILEPESTDGAVAWGFLSTAPEKGARYAIGKLSEAPLVPSRAWAAGKQ